MWVWIKANWERVFLFLIAAVFLVFSIDFFLKSEVTGATASFVMFFLCLIYSNVSRFKRFKGLGFEAELWEDKQKEAEHLIDQLRKIIEIYTREILTQKVMSDRFGNGVKWNEKWKFIENLIGQHDLLGQKVDFRIERQLAYGVMIYDTICIPVRVLEAALSTYVSRAEQAINFVEFPAPMLDEEKRLARHQELRSLRPDFGDLYELSKSKNIAKHVLDTFDMIVHGFREKFEIEVEVPLAQIERLRKIQNWINEGNFEPHPELIRMADHED